MDETIALSFSVIFKKIVCLRALLANSSQKNLLASDKLLQSHGLYNIKKHRKQRCL